VSFATHSKPSTWVTAIDINPYKYRIFNGVLDEDGPNSMASDYVSQSANTYISKFHTHLPPYYLGTAYGDLESISAQGHQGTTSNRKHLTTRVPTSISFREMMI
jgi:hypothetical protein